MTVLLIIISQFLDLETTRQTHNKSVIVLRLGNFSTNHRKDVMSLCAEFAVLVDDEGVELDVAGAFDAVVLIFNGSLAFIALPMRS